MSEIATYTFLPWLRQGVANTIDAEDGDNTISGRAAIPVALTVRGQGLDGGELSGEVSRNVQLYGPGDIVGIDQKAIIKTEPANWITNFEPNYLPYIDFYEEDFPWRYTPAAPDTDTHRLRPWISLVVLTEEEFSDGQNIAERPLPFIKIENPTDVLPTADELWAWAHVHINEALDDDIIANNPDTIATAFNTLIHNDPDLAYARLLCPRKLAPKTGYHAFLIPSFETGRLAGLGLDPAQAPFATHGAWNDYTGDATKPEGQHFPYYHRWYFRTGEQGDFEYLVRLLEPGPVDSRVGQRDMDVQRPGINIAGLNDPELNGILKLGGALKVPEEAYSEEEWAEVQKYNNWAQGGPKPIQADIAAFINLKEDYQQKSAGTAHDESSLDINAGDNPDPLLTAPLYGRWHALVNRLLEEQDGTPLSNTDNWVHELNLDPRWRVAAGLGTKVIQQNQEDYMKSAWEQIGDVLEANRRIRLAQLAKTVSTVWYKKHLTPLYENRSSKWISLAAPVQKRIISQGITVHHQLAESTLTAAAVSLPLRKSLRPAARLSRLSGFTREEQAIDTLLPRLNSGEVTAAPPYTVPDTLPTVEDVSDQIEPEGVPEAIKDLVSKYPWLHYLVLLLAILMLLLALLFPSAGLFLLPGIALAAGLFYIYRLLRNWTKKVQDADSISVDQQKPEVVDDFAPNPDFRISTPEEGFLPGVSTAGTDSAEAVNFKAALKDAYTLVELSAQLGETPVRKPAPVATLAADSIRALNPELTIVGKINTQIFIPGRIRDQIGEKFVEPMAYPKFEMPMYEPLVGLSTEFFLPNINYIGQNTISLLETNQAFIESYMVGLNHEMGRELLWREYLTDQRGSYFRQFWDVSSFLDTEPDLTEEERKEKYKDIPPLHRWSTFSKLGDHDHRERPGDTEEEAVLVIRGELLKRYPNAVIYAHRARWQRDENGELDNAKERRLVELTEAEQGNPPGNKLKTPLYQAKVKPDIFFLGFDLTVDEAQGGTGENPDDDPGWFFVIKERPGEPRFGLDIAEGGEAPALQIWNDLSWEHVLPGTIDGQFISPNHSFNLTEPTGTDSEKQPQWEEDREVSWTPAVNAANLAYVLYQVPVLVAVHAAELLPRK